MKAIRQLIQKSEKSSNRSLESLRHLMFLFLLCGSIGAWAADYVIYDNGHFFAHGTGTNITSPTTFSASSCVWTTSSSTYLKNGSYGINSNAENPPSISIVNGNGVAWTVDGNRFGYKSGSRFYYLNNYNNGWTTARSGRDAAINTLPELLYAVSQQEASLTAPTITGEEYISTTGNHDYSASATYSQACYKFTGKTTYYGVEGGTLSETAPIGTVSYSWNITPNDYATINTSNGRINVTSIPNQDTQVTITVTASSGGLSEQSSKTITLTKSAPVAAGYVFYSGGTNGAYLNSATNNTAFNPSTSLWTLNNNKFINGGNNYLRLNSSSQLSLSNTDSRNTVVLSGTESGTTGQRVYINNSRYLRYDGGWTVTQTADNTGTNVVYAVTQLHAEGANPTMPTISATRSGNAINFTHTNITGTYSPTYDDYIFYNGTDHYWYNNALVNLNQIPAAKGEDDWGGVTYTWSIAAGGDYAQINPTTGVLTFKNAMPTTATNVTVRLTTTNTGVTELNNKTVDYTFTLTPTAGTLTVPTITGDNIITENGTYNYVATSTSTPSYTTVTGIGSTFYVQNSNILGTQPTASPITYTYALSNNAGYATINSSTGAITVTNVPNTGDHQMTLTVTATADGMTETATLPIHLTKENKISETGMYVITYQNSHFLGGTSTADITSFDPATCLWTGTDGGTWRNSAGYYISNNGSNGNLTFSTDPGSTWNISGTENGETGQELYHSSGYNYSIRWYNSAWTARRNNGTNNRLFAVTKDTYLPFDQNPLIAGDTQIADLGNNSSFHRTQDAIHNAERYVDYVFYNGNHHYFDMNGNAYTPTTFTYTWSLSDNANGYATIDAATGVITYTNYVQEDRIITVTLTATAGTDTKTATQTVTLKAPQNPTAITAQNVELAVGDPDYTLTYTLTPSTRVYNYVVASGNSDIVTVSPGHVTNKTNTGDFTIHPVSIGSTTLTLSAKKTGTSNAEEACAKTITITVKDRCIRPTITLDNTTGKLAMVTTTEGATIHYTLDGSTPTESSPVYDPDNKPVLTATTTVKAITTKADMMTSAVETQTFTQIATPTLTANSDGTITLGCEVEGVTYYYTTDGNDPTLESTQTTGTVSDVASGTTVKVIAVKEGMITSKVGSKEIRYTVATPVIEINEETGAVTITCATPDATIHYTIDNSVPTSTSPTYTTESTLTITNGQTVKAIAYKADYNDSGMATDRYMISSGVSGGTVILNDYEDHTWTYYAGVDSSVDGGYYNDTYIAQGTGTKREVRMYSPNPRNVKITYNGVNGVSGSTTTVKVSVRTNEDQTSFVYYKTLEEGTTTGQYPYQVISNPFSVRPSTGSGDSKKFYGFAGWKIVSGGEYIDGYNNDDTLPLDADIIFVGLPYPSVNCTSAEIVFETSWTQATVKRGGGNVSSNDFSDGTYETNFCVINANSNALSPTYPVTITGVEPDGSATYTNTIGGTVTPADNTANGQGSYMTKLEYVTWNPGGDINARGRNFTIGRGVNTTSRQNVQACANDVNVNQVFKIESGDYGTFTHYTANPSAITKQWIIFGNDYDRANNDNTKLLTRGQMEIGNSRTLGLSSTDEMARTWIKSGDLMNNTNVSDAAAGNSYYYSVEGTHNNGYRYLEMQGGILPNIAGGMGENHTSTEPGFTFRMKGGKIRGSVYGAAAFANAGGTRTYIITGGEINGWVAAGANGTQNDGGQNKGASYVYIGGNAKIDSKHSTTYINRSVGGNVYGAGCGYSGTSNSGEMTLGSNMVVADNAYIERGIYGGGAYGFVTNTQTSYIYVTGGHVGGYTGTDYGNTTVQGGVYGGARQNKGGAARIYMTGGTVDTGIYGGSNYTGTMNLDVVMQINGGTVNGNIHGGGYGQNTQVNRDVEITLGKTGSARDAEGVTVWGDVYGGSALGKVNGNAATDTYHTYVTMNAGYIHGSLYGGALGSNTVAANVYGPVQVKVYGGSVMKTDENGANGSGAVYGANNINGAPQRAVTVDIYGTNSAPAEGEYALFSVYGGGNAANYTYGNDYPKVTVHNCDNSIEYVYGGGNAAAVAATDVTIYGGDKIGNVFGGGNGQVKAANVTGNTNVKIYGGTIGDVYGGSNTNGSIGGTISVNVNAQGEDGSTCPINIDNVYGGGNKAASASGNITIGCAEHIGAVYGGANQANVNGNVNLAINAGHIDNVFGGNNQSGDISGTITVTVNDNGSECGMVVGNVYGGGNQAAYGHGTNYPVVNIQNGHLTGSVFGGGLGETAVVVGNPTVNIGDWIGGHSVVISGDVFGGGDLAAVEGNPTVTIRDCGTLIMGDLYGGGNAAPVYSTNTTMWGGTVMGNVFGGGNGADPTKNPNGAQVGYKRDDSTTDGTGNATLNVFGGTIGTWDGEECEEGTGGIFGGSNTNGNITGTVNFTLDDQTCNEEGANNCTLKLKEVYGSGNEAAYVGTGINFNLGCVSSLSEIYGGAKNADMNGDIHLIISSGRFNRVFGGNNIGGRINGSIKVTIDETGCEPVIIDELYGCGNNAAYSVYGYNEDGTVKTSGTSPKANPEVNIISFTHIGKVFGGGYGSKAVVVGSPTVNINVIPGKHANSVNTTVQSYLDAHKLGSIGTVFGGGNAANVVGNTSVNIGTVATNAHIAKEGDSDIDTSPKSVGANITGNVYGGGNAADVTGKTNVVVGQPKTTPVTP